MSVGLPQPFAPTSPTRSSSPIASDTPDRIGRAWNFFSMSLSARSVIPAHDTGARDSELGAAERLADDQRSREREREAERVQGARPETQRAAPQRVADAVLPDRDREHADEDEAARDRG